MPPLINSPPMSQSVINPSSSQESVYYDAPIMHFFSKSSDSNKDNDKQDTNGNLSANGVGDASNDESKPVANGKTNGDVARQPSVAGGGHSSRRRSPPPRSPSVSSLSSLETEDAPPTRSHTLTKSSVRANRRSRTLSPAGSRRSQSRQASPPTQSILRSPSRAASVRGIPDGGSAFINGAGTTGPNAEPDMDESVHARSIAAEQNMTEREKEKVRKGERKDSRRLSKIIKDEGKNERAALDVLIKELRELQQLQKEAIKNESSLHTSHTDAMVSVARATGVLQKAQIALARAEAEEDALRLALEEARAQAREATEGVALKAREVEGARRVRGVDERERVGALKHLMGKA